MTEIWWRTAGGLPDRMTSSARVARSAVAAGFLAVFLTGSTGVAAAVRFDGDDERMRRFCTAYANQPPAPRIESARDFERPEVQAAFRHFESTNALALRSGNVRLEAAFRALDREIRAGFTEDPTATPEPAAERFVRVSMTSFTAALEECDRAGHPIAREGG